MRLKRLIKISVGKQRKEKNKTARDGASSVHHMAGASSSTPAEGNLAF
ncbi:MAG: hypothetical protein V4727_11740 [Verrucomicrobiota bacterium]